MYTYPTASMPVLSVSLTGGEVLLFLNDGKYTQYIKFILFTIALKRIKYLGIDFPKEMKDVSNESY